MNLFYFIVSFILTWWNWCFCIFWFILWFLFYFIIKKHQQQQKSFFSTEAATNVYSKSENSQPETMEFQAETRKLLDIVANALYTEKEGINS